MFEMNIESYPPLFRPNNNLALDEFIEHIDDDLDPLPVVDLQCLDANKLDEACKNWGLFRLVNHGVPWTLLSQLNDQAKKLFSLSFEYKQAILSSPLSYVWGTVFLSPTGTGVKSGSKGVNWAEVMNFPLAQLPQFHSQDPLLHSFSELVEEYGKHVLRIGRSVLEVMAMKLKLNPSEYCSESSSYMAESTGLIRAMRYPKVSKGKQAWGAGPHTDGSLLSILSQDQIGGLEVCSQNKWYPVKPIPNTLIINLGDIMQAISNDEYVSAKHRVRVYKQEDRISINYFVFPELDCVIKSSNYKPFTFSEFKAQGQKSLETLGFIGGLQSFKLNINN